MSEFTTSSIMMTTTTPVDNEAPMPRSCLNKSIVEYYLSSEVDFSQQPYFNKHSQGIDTHEIVIKIILCLVSISASLIGNVLVIYSMLIKPKLKKKEFKYDFYVLKQNSYNRKKQVAESHNPDLKAQGEKTIKITRIYKPNNNKKTVNFFILNLCFCDLMIVVWCSWIHMINSVSNNWRMGAFFCKFNTYVQIASLIASISTLSVISFERFLGIVFTVNKKLNHKNSIRIIIGIWVFSMIAAVPALVYRKQTKMIWKDYTSIQCIDVWPKNYIFEKGSKDCVIEYDQPLLRIYYTFISLVLFFIPIMIMLICNCLIIRKLNHNQIMGFFSENSSEKNLLNKRRQKVNNLLIGLLVSFAVCWTPVLIFILNEAYKKPSYVAKSSYPGWLNWVYFFAFLLAYTNSAINPIFITGLNKFYKAELKKIFSNFGVKRRPSETIRQINNQNYPKLKKINEYS